MTVDEMVEAGFALCMSDGLLPEEAASNGYDDRDSAAVYSLAIQGLRSLIGNRLFHDRGEAENLREIEPRLGSPRSGHFQHRTEPRERAVYFWLSKAYESADGRTVRLINFTPEDWQHNAGRAAGKVAGWQARLDLFNAGQREMSKHRNALTTADLPKAALARLDTLAQSTFQGRTVVA